MKPSSAVTPTLVGLALGLLAAAAASAQPLVTARVLSAQPVWEPVPVSDCAPGYGGQPSGAGAGVGAVMGGLIGSQMGKGSGHIAGAILGALGGAMLGNVAEAQQRGVYGGYPGGCATGYQNRMTGYDVTYELGGRQYRTRTAQNPGPWLQVPMPGSDPYYGGGYSDGPYAGVPGVQSYPVNLPPVAAYPLPSYPAAGESSGVVTAPPVYGGYYPGAGYPAPYPAPVYRQAYPQPAYPAAPMYVRPAPAYVAPVGVNLSIGGGSRRGGWGVGIGTGF